MSRSAKHCRFCWSCTPVSEIMQHEIKIVLDRSCHFKIEIGKLSYFRRQCCNGWRIPDLQKQGFKIIRQPIRFLICIFNSHEHIAYIDWCSFTNCLDFNRKFSFMLIENIFPTLSVEYSFSNVVGNQFICLIDFLFSYHAAFKILLDNVLKAVKNSFVKLWAHPTFKIGIYFFCTFRVEVVMSHLITVCQQTNIVFNHNIPYV